MWCGVVWCGVVWCGVVWCGVLWCGVVWCGVVWCVVVWCGVVWCGAVRCGALAPAEAPRATGHDVVLVITAEAALGNLRRVGRDAGHGSTAMAVC